MPALATSGAPATSDPAAALGLTPREIDVLRLLAHGRSNREIGEALFISPRTVNFHVTNLLAKLELDSRTPPPPSPSVTGWPEPHPTHPGQPDRSAFPGRLPQSGNSDGAHPAPLWHRESR